MTPSSVSPAFLTVATAWDVGTRIGHSFGVSNLKAAFAYFGLRQVFLRRGDTRATQWARAPAATHHGGRRARLGLASFGLSPSGSDCGVLRGRLRPAR
jgi:hypothetical protein